MRSTGEVLLEMRRVEVRLRAGAPGCAVSVRALARVDLCLRAGERVLVTGAPASGKTALLLTAAGLLSPSRGHVARAATVLVADACGVHAASGGKAPRGRPALLLADDLRTAADVRRLRLVCERLDAALLAAWAGGAAVEACDEVLRSVRLLRLDGGRLRAVDAGDSRRTMRAPLPAPAEPLLGPPPRASARRVASVAEPS